MKSNVSERFAVTPWTDLDWDVGGEGLVGLNLAADVDLQRDILTVLVARRLGNRSIDYTKKVYTRTFEGQEDRDTAIKELWATQRTAYDRFYHAIPTRNDAPIGIFAFDLALVRARPTVDLLLYSARRGMLIESCLLARSLLEQLAYAVAVWGLDDDDPIFSTQPQTVIRELGKIYPGARKAYGVLSELSHYNPREHHQFIGTDEPVVIQRSWKFKAVALAWLLFILDVKASVFSYAYENTNEYAGDKLGELHLSIREMFKDMFLDIDLPLVKVVKSLMKIE